MATVCQDSKCEEGGNEVCCHECNHFDGCRSAWKCDDPKFYEDCRENSGIEHIFDWSDIPR